MFLPFFNFSILNDFIASVSLKASPTKKFKGLKLFLNFDTLNQISFDYFSTIFFGLKSYTFLNYINIFYNYFYYILFSLNYIIIILVFIFLRFFKINLFSLIFNFKNFIDYFVIFNKVKRKVKNYLLYY